MKYVIVGTVLLVVMSASVLGQMSANTSPRKAQESTQTAASDIREAVVRYQISTWQLAASSYCVKIDGKDADKKFLMRFHPLPVKGASGCQKQTPPKLPKFIYSIVDKQTKKNSVVFDIGELRWLKQSEAEVDGGYHCASECMAAGTYHVVWDGTRWTVTAFNIHIQS